MQIYNIFKEQSLMVLRTLTIFSNPKLIDATVRHSDHSANGPENAVRVSFLRSSLGLVACDAAVTLE